MCIMVRKVCKHYTNNDSIILGSSFSVPPHQLDFIGSDRKQELRYKLVYRQSSYNTEVHMEIILCVYVISLPIKQIQA